MNSTDFRRELNKIMPGCDWTVRRPDKRADAISGRKTLSATGVQSSGFNRLCTLRVDRREQEGKPVAYEAKIAEYGTKSPWASTGHGNTLAQALRDLQQTCERAANRWGALASHMQNARAQKPAQAKST